MHKISNCACAVSSLARCMLTGGVVLQAMSKCQKADWNSSIEARVMLYTGPAACMMPVCDNFLYE